MTESPRWIAFVNPLDGSDTIWCDARARRKRLDCSADRPAGRARALSLEGKHGRTVVEVVPARITRRFATFWVHRIEGAWPTPSELVDSLMDGCTHFGATVDIRPGNVALVQVAID